jgi:hypothetical protein
MSIARYLSKFAALLGSDGKVPAASMGNDAPLGLKSIQVFSTAGSFTWTKPTGIRKVKVIVTGGGAGGGGWDSDDGGAGGGAGGTAIKLIDVTGVSSVAVTVASGGAAGVNTSPTSSAGSTSSFGSYCSAAGGTGPTNWSQGGLGGAATGGDINIYGGSGETGHTDGYGNSDNGATGGCSYWGGGTRGTGTWVTGAAAYNNCAFGAGGGGGNGNSGTQGSAGNSGIVVVEEYA